MGLAPRLDESIMLGVSDMSNLKSALTMVDLDRIIYKGSWANMTSNGILISSTISAQLTHLPDTQADTQTMLHATHVAVDSICTLCAGIAA